MKASYQRVVGALVLIVLGVISRICLRVCLPPGNNFVMFDMFAAVAVFALLAGCLLGGIYSFTVPLAIMFISDLYYGNNYIFLFTWSGFAFVGLLGYALKNKVNYTPKFILSLAGTGILGVLIYDLWTNFGWWLCYYPRSISGLGLCYLMALPFTIGHLISSSIVIPLVSIPAVYIYKYGLPIPEMKISRLEKHVTITAVIFLALVSLF